MSATRSRSISSKNKNASTRGRSISTASRGAKGGRGAGRKKNARDSKPAAPARRKSRGRAGATRASRSPIGQAIELLMQDHRKVQKLFRQAERVKDDAERLRPIVEEACAALKQHTRIEERHFYPVMHDAGKDADVIAEAYVEHGSAKQLIAQLERGDADDEQYAATFTVLGEYVKHHIKEEEGEIFPKARRARADFKPLLDALMARERGGTEPSTGARGARPEEAEAPGRRTARGRQARGRATRENAAAEADAGAGAANEPVGSDVEQPRRGRRGATAEETGETETAGRGRERESVEQEDRSREGNR